MPIQNKTTSNKIHLTQCPCGSNIIFSNCCELIHNNHSLAIHAEQLMRARYTAFVIGNTEFIVQTYHHSSRPSIQSEDTDNIKNSTSLNWCKLEILSHSNPTSTIAYVEFKAWFIEDGQLQVMHENSRFVKASANSQVNSQLCWFYIDGEFIDDKDSKNQNEKISRNSLCPCGSGKKYKRCCAA